MNAKKVKEVARMAVESIVFAAGFATAIVLIGYSNFIDALLK